MIPVLIIGISAAGCSAAIYCSRRNIKPAIVGIDFGGEMATTKLGVTDIQQIQNQNPHGWIVLFDNDADFISKDAVNYIKQNFAQIDNSQVRGASAAYIW